MLELPPTQSGALQPRVVDCLIFNNSSTSITTNRSTTPALQWKRRECPWFSSPSSLSGCWPCQTATRLVLMVVVTSLILATTGVSSRSLLVTSFIQSPTKSTYRLLQSTCIDKTLNLYNPGFVRGLRWWHRSPFTRPLPPLEFLQPNLSSRCIIYPCHLSLTRK